VTATRPGGAIDVVCCSLEPWDDVWRRNQFIATELIRQQPQLRLLFVELPVDVTWSLSQRQWPGGTGLRPIGASGRLWALRPRKWLPRRVWPRVDRSLHRQVLGATRELGFERPVLWINDSTYAGLVAATGWPSIYDVTDDWLLGRYPPAEILRQRSNDAAMVRDADEVVVCSPALARSRGRQRPLHLVANGVDTDHLRQPAARPDDLPPGAIVLYTGTLSEGRLDVELCLQLCSETAERARFVLVGPNSLSPSATRRLEQAGALFLGARPYEKIPAYLQHADVFVVPHAVTPFTESLDPIKAREVLAVGRPAVSTAVAGFRDLGPPVIVASRETFVAEVVAILERGPITPGPGPIEHPPISWADRASEFLEILAAAHAERTTARPASVVPAGLPAVEVVVVAYGDPKHLERCLDTLDDAFGLVTVDNSSNPETEALVLRHGGRYLDPGRNLGFGAGVNLALEHASADSDVLLLNPDATIGPADVVRLQATLRAAADLAAVGPTQRTAPGAPAERVCWPFPSPLGAWIEAVGLGRWQQRCDFVIGSVLLLRREAIVDVGGFDERFFLYAEETDWQRRARQRGWRVAVCAEAEAEHVGAATDTDTARREIRFHAGTERYIRKWYGDGGWAAYRLAAAFGAGVRAALRSGPDRRSAARRAALYLRGPDRSARSSGSMPAPPTRIPTFR
jgi:teichuronic acid biosynthesis glycosyltransferase TuaH